MKLIKNAQIYTGYEVIENGYLAYENGKITAVGAGAYPGSDATCTIDAEGRKLFPGFIDAHTHLGMTESAIGFEGRDGNECTDPATPHVRAIDGINPMDVTFQEARSAGVTTAASGPGSGNVIGGQYCVLKTWGHRIDKMVIKAPLAMKCAFGENPKRVYNGKGKLPSTRMGTAAVMRNYLSKTVQYLAKKEAAGDDMSKLPKFDMKLEAMIPVIKREIPLKAHAHRADDIYTILRICKEFNVRATIEHATEGHLMVDDLLEAGVPCIVGPSFGHRSKFELINKTFATPGILDRAGVKVALTTDASVTPLQYLPILAGLAVKAGMTEAAALRAITINAAEILELDARIGSLEVGKDADFSIFNGHPFTTSGQAWKVFIDGSERYSLEEEGILI